MQMELLSYSSQCFFLKIISVLNERGLSGRQACNPSPNFLCYMYAFVALVKLFLYQYYKSKLSVEVYWVFQIINLNWF